MKKTRVAKLTVASQNPCANLSPKFCYNGRSLTYTMGGVSLTGGAAMSRPLTIRKPNADELHQLHQWLEQPLQSWQRRRAEVLLLYAADGSVSSIAQLLQVHRNTVSTDLREFARHGLAALSRPRKLGAPPRLSKQQIAAIWRLADQRPPPWGCRWAAGAWPSCARTSSASALSPRSAASTCAGC